MRLYLLVPEATFSKAHRHITAIPDICSDAKACRRMAKSLHPSTMPTQRYCLALDLKNDPTLIAEYEAHHQKVWPEIQKSIQDAGITQHGNLPLPEPVVYDHGNGRKLFV
jgi:hypothetical protein